MRRASLEVGVHARLAMLGPRMEACVYLPERPAAFAMGQRRGTWRAPRSASLCAGGARGVASELLGRGVDGGGTRGWCVGWW